LSLSPQYIGNLKTFPSLSAPLRNSSINLQCLAHPDNPAAAVGSDLEVT